MKTQANAPTVGSGSPDDRLADLAEELARRLALGDEAGADRLLADNPAHADELRALLPAARLMAGLGRSEPPQAESAPLPAGLGRDLGDFRLLREIGRGGMGVVYEAEQLSLRRRVALKVLPAAAALDARALQRFRNEAVAAAGLHHPNVVPVYGVGVERGVHYLAMQFVDGPPLSDLVRVARAEAGLDGGERPAGPTREGVSGAPPASDPLAATVVPSIDPRPASPSAGAAAAAPASAEFTGRGAARHRSAARLVRQAAEALEYAHSLGVVHRDVKPSNLLLDSRGNPWVADFGLAQLEGDAGLTTSGDLLGTLRYMSPEQATGRRGLVDHRSDVYGLGLTLYELLTLRPAFPQEHRAALTRAVIAEDPPRPRRLDPAIPRDLETVLLKATEKDPARRYQSAKAFADDLGRFLAGEPISARRPTVADRSAKWVGRHRGFSLSAAVILAVVAGASTFTTAEIGAAYEQETKHRKDAEDAAARAAANYDLARQAVARMLTHVGAEHLSRVPEFAPVRTKVLKEAAAFCDEMVSANLNDPHVYLDRARVRDLLGDYAGELADLRKAADLEPAFTIRHVMLSQFYESVPDVAFRDYDRAVEHGRIAVSLAPESATAHEVLGRALMRAARLDEAATVLRTAASLAPESGGIRKSLSEALYASGDAEGALAAVREAIRLDPELPWTWQTLAEILKGLGRNEEALAAVDESIRLHGKEVDITFCWYLEQRGKILKEMGRDAEAIAAWDRAIELAPFRSYPFKWRGAAKFRIGRYADALADLSRSLELKPDDLSALKCVPPADAARCPDPAFREGLLRLADVAVERDPNSAKAQAIRSELASALRDPSEAPKPAARRVD